MTLRSHLLRQLREEIIKHLPKSNEQAKLRLRVLEIEHLLIRYLTWRDRIIHNHPRKVCRSREIRYHPKYLDNRHNIDRICAKAAAGISLTEHLSRRVLFAYEPNKSSGRGKDFDGLLADWGIHHLHTSHNLEPDGFCERGEHLIAAIFTPAAMYLIDIIDHDSWSDISLISTAIRNWPNEDLFLPIRGAIPRNKGLSNEDYRLLRRAGISSLLTVDGAVYASRNAGITTAHTPVSATITAHRIIRNITFLTSSVENATKSFSQCSDYRRSQWPKFPNLAVRLASTHDRYCVCIEETHTGLFVSIE